MGTNYSFFTKNKQLAKEYFPARIMPNDRRCDGAVLVDEPEFGYEIHIAKTSYGWVPLFESHIPTFGNFTELESFYMAHKDDLTVLDEYGTEYSWDEFKNMMIRHSQREHEAMKWVYDVDPIFGKNKCLHTRKCPEGETPDLYIPFRHDEYDRTQKEAARKYGTRHYGYDGDADVPYRDDKYDFDWTYGTFG